VHACLYSLTVPSENFNAKVIGLLVFTCFLVHLQMDLCYIRMSALFYGKIQARLMNQEFLEPGIQGARNSDSEHLKLLGDRVRQARARRGMSRKLLAKDSGVSERYLAQLETGQGNISILLLRRIANAINVPVETLIR
jgi:DNA-binding XRE family transcriptional regulator